MQVCVCYQIGNQGGFGRDPESHVAHGMGVGLTWLEVVIASSACCDTVTVAGDQVKVKRFL